MSMRHANKKENGKHMYSAADNASSPVHNYYIQQTINFHGHRPDTECTKGTVFKFLPQHREDTSHLANGTDLVSNDFFPEVGSCTCK